MSVELLAILSIFPWAFVLVYIHPKIPVSKLLFTLFGALALGWLATELVLQLNAWFWPNVPVPGKKPSGSILSQTVHIAFVQAGMMEEACKSALILGFSYLVAYDRQAKRFLPEVFLIGGFVALGFAGVENYHYIQSANEHDRVATFIARTLKSTNAHLLINLCFSLFLIKSNFKEKGDKAKYLVQAFLLAVFQHGLFDFFVLPNGRFGAWIAIALFVGIWVWIVKDRRKYLVPLDAEIVDDVRVRLPNLSSGQSGEV
ncbi:protease PrsW family protein [Leptospira broomii serovar Hurstbridge str. 5399]|uniref:Protease PrsW family protein n=1 Tax=Leptospira broomii serovar Hurstbridge str. 5399 TaxID=1049789 RepID=T0GBP9_9LEPT|nr:PrsW family glutamic-type intramembrane protease [Leptospira broomii]EQA44234.1 protease PrsW family protein [Leptospira broomii serovar Hurstbridge str. 5399]